MSDWRLRDTLGLLIIFSVLISAAQAVDGVAQALIVLVGVVIALLWIANFFLRGYTESRHETESNH